MGDENAKENSQINRDQLEMERFQMSLWEFFSYATERGD
jgi:hypothetical protein